MQQVKIFKTVETEIHALEDEVNAWIGSAGIRVISITGNIAPQSEPQGGFPVNTGSMSYTPSDVLLIVLYEKPDK